MTIKEAKEIATDTFVKAYDEIKDYAVFPEDAARYACNCINDELLDTGFACAIDTNNNGSIKIDLFKKECVIGAVYAKEVKNDSNH